MKAETAEELVELVERRCAVDGDSGWDYPLIIERLKEIADDVRDAVETAEDTREKRTGETIKGRYGVTTEVTLHEDDHAWLAGLAQVLAEALET